jgi:hypothetical protein
MLRTILGGSSQFSFPKSLYSVRDTLSIVTRHKPNSDKPKPKRESRTRYGLPEAREMG